MAPPSIFVGTPSIFESLMLIQIYLYCKTIITQVLQYYTWTKLYHDVILGESEYISCDNYVSFSSNSSFSPYRHFWKCFTLRLLWVLVCCGKFHKKSVKGKGCKLCINKLSSSWLFPKSFYHSFVLQMTLLHSTN